MLGRDSSGALYGADGRPSKRRNNNGSSSASSSTSSKAMDGGSVALAAPPLALAVSGPYVVGLAEAGGEARLLEPLTHAEGELLARLLAAWLHELGPSTQTVLSVTGRTPQLGAACGSSVHNPHAAPLCADLWQHLALALPGAHCAVAPSAADDGSLFVADRGSGAIKQVSIAQRSWLPDWGRRF